MRRVTLLAAAALGLLFPLGLALAVYVASAASLDDPAGLRVGTEPLGQVTVTLVQTERTGTTTEPTTTDRDDDVSGKCDEPEHRSDPDCVGAGTRTEEDDGSGRGRGRGGDSDDSSGSGSDSSGKGSGGDD
jgi:uncharacterized membrane protein YgcG